MDGRTYRGQPGGGWTDVTAESQANDAAKALSDSQAKIDSQNTANQQANDARFAADKGELSSFIDSYKTAVPQIISDTSNKYNLPTLTGQANALGTRTNDLSGNLTGEGAGGYASSGQVDKAISTNYLPRYQQAISNLANANTQAQSEENQLVAPYTTQATALNDRLNREATAYTAEQQQTLDSLVAQMNAGVTLTSQQIQQATTLAQAESQYNATVDAATIKNQAPQNVTAGSYIYDPVSQTYKLIK